MSTIDAAMDRRACLPTDANDSGDDNLRLPEQKVTSSRASTRVGWIDGVRGFAVLLMVIYHFSFDLNHFGVINQNFNYSPFWLGFRGVIVTLFTTLVGVSLVLAAGRSSRRGFWKRQLKLAVCAGLVTISSFLMFPDTYIYFGVLHFIFVASLLALPFVQHPRISLVLGAAALVVGNLYSDRVFDWGPLNWIGFMTHKPYTEDYVPLFPWMGLVWVGIAIGHFWKQKQWPLSAPRALRWAGRNSLEIYMLHQPLLIGMLTAFSYLIRPL